MTTSDARTVDDAARARELRDKIDVERARRAIDGRVLHTPVIACPELDALAGGGVVLKAECLQKTGSFKLRGALNRVAAITERSPAGLVTASAGNHARAVAQAARIVDTPCTVFMPREAPVLKVAAVERLGAKVHLEGASVDEALGLAVEHARQAGALFIHPFDDLDVIAGQGTIGLELLEDVPDLARVIVPVGGGGLASGIGSALAHADVKVELIGVQASNCAPFASALDGEPRHGVAVGTTIADGIAIKRPGSITWPLLGSLLGGLDVVSEDEIGAAMVFLVEATKLVAEGAGAAAVAALLSGRLPPVEGTTVALVSGGNVDSGLLAGLLLRHESEEGRRVRIFTRVPDRPGGLAELLELVAHARVNVVNVEHVREAVPLHVRETGVELTLETRGPGHTQEMLEALRTAGYEAELG